MNRRMRIGIAALAIFVVIEPLRRLQVFFNGDWYTHLWPAVYLGRFFHAHGYFPSAINPELSVYNPIPIFYGSMFFPFAGLLANLVGGDVAYRLIFIALFALQFSLVYLAVQQYGRSQRVSLIAAVLVTWAIYPLTNLYSRGALPEFVASVLISSGLCAWFLLLRAKSARQRALLCLLCAFCLSFAIGTHPITAMYSIPILALLCTVSFLQEKPVPKKTLPWIGTAAVFTLIASLPFLYIAFKYSRHTMIGSGSMVDVVVAEGDSWWVRFLPLPFDRRSLRLGIHLVTPYMDLQINDPLLLLLGGALAACGWRQLRRKTAFWILAVFFILLTWMSVSTAPYAFLPNEAKIVQASFRLISFQNLVLLSAFFLVLNEQTAKRIAPILLVSCLCVGACAAMMKYLHTRAIETPLHLAETYPGPDAFPKGFMLGNYTSSLIESFPEKKAAALPEIRFPVSRGRDFGHVGNVSFDHAQPGWVRTNISAFEWNQIQANGKVLSPLKKAASNLVVFIPAGHFELSADCKTDPTWILLRRLSYCVIFIGFLGFCGLLALAVMELTQKD